MHVAWVEMEEMPGDMIEQSSEHTRMELHPIKGTSPLQRGEISYLERLSIQQHRLGRSLLVE